MTDETQRLKDALWRIKVDPHGHPGEVGHPVPEDECPVCSVVNAVLQTPWFSLDDPQTGKRYGRVRWATDTEAAALDAPSLRATVPRKDTA